MFALRREDERAVEAVSGSQDEAASAVRVCALRGLRRSVQADESGQWRDC